jgi:hypothetical protein
MSEKITGRKAPSEECGCKSAKMEERVSDEIVLDGNWMDCNQQRRRRTRSAGKYAIGPAATVSQTGRWNRERAVDGATSRQPK